MAWISLVVAIVILYRPFLAYGLRILDQPVPLQLPFGTLVVGGDLSYVILLLVSFVVWAVGWVALLAVERWLLARRSLALDILGLPGPFNLRNGMLYAMSPPVGVGLAIWLARILLGYYALTVLINLVLSLAGASLPPILLTVLTFLQRILFQVSLEVVNLALLTVVAGGFYKRELRWRYQWDVHRRDIERQERDELQEGEEVEGTQ